MKLKAFIPNAITLLNLFCGCIATLYAVENQLEYAAYWVFLGIFLDFFDGFFARILNVKSDLGIQLDSLADMITSGLVPGIFLYQLLQTALQNQPLSGSFDISWIATLGFLVTLASAYRLGKFNIDTEQKEHFIGLPTPANTLLIVSIPFLMGEFPSSFLDQWIVNPWFLITLILVSTYLLNSSINMFSLKITSTPFKGNEILYLFAVYAVVLFVVLKVGSFPLIILSYILVSIVTKLWSSTKK